MKRLSAIVVSIAVALSISAYGASRENQGRNDIARSAGEPQSQPEVWLCMGDRVSDLLDPAAEWDFVKEHLSGIQFYIDRVNRMPSEKLEQFVRLIRRQYYQVAIECGGTLDFAPMDSTNGERSAQIELAKIDKFYAAGGKVDFLNIDGPIRRLMHPQNRRRGGRFDSVEKAADELVDYLRIVRKAHPEIGFFLLTNFPNWGYRGGMSYHARGPQRQDWGDYDTVVKVVLGKLRAANIPLAGVTVDNPYEYLVGARKSATLEDPTSIDWLARVRSYEDFARGGGLKFNLIVNSEVGGKESDELFYNNTLKMVDAYIEAGGRPDRWFIQSWYGHPVKVVPESAPFSMTALVKAAIGRIESAQASRRPGNARVIVSTDIGGGDPDDFQSMVHYLVYADVFETEGLISSPPQRGRKRDILECIAAYDKDYANLRTWSRNYPSPDALRGVTRQGAIYPQSGEQPATKISAGARLIIERARIEDPRPLYVLVWGSITDVAQAVHKDPKIKTRLRIHSIGSWNTGQDPKARNYLFNNHRDLWWIESDSTFRGMYMGGVQNDDLGNRSFTEKHVKGHGHLGPLFMRKKADIKMGDTPSVLYMLHGNPDKPESPHWGGAFVRPDPNTRPTYWHDNPAESLSFKGKKGANTVNKWRKEYLLDWKRRMDRILTIRR